MYGDSIPARPYDAAEHARALAHDALMACQRAGQDTRSAKLNAAIALLRASQLVFPVDADSSVRTALAWAREAVTTLEGARVPWALRGAVRLLASALRQPA